MGSLPHKFKCEDLVYGQCYMAYIIGFREWKIYVAALPYGKDYLQFLDVDGFFHAPDNFYCWTSDLREIKCWDEKLADAEFELQQMLEKRREKEKRKKEGRSKRK